MDPRSPKRAFQSILTIDSMSNGVHETIDSGPGTGSYSFFFSKFYQKREEKKERETNNFFHQKMENSFFLLLNY